MNGEIKVAVCDDLEEDRQVLVNLLSEYTDKNNLYVKIQEFTSGEAFLASDTSEYSLVFMDIFMDGINGMETAKALIVRNSRVQIVFESTSTEFAAEAWGSLCLWAAASALICRRGSCLGFAFCCWPGWVLSRFLTAPSRR